MEKKNTEVQLQTGTYRTTVVGVEILKPSTKEEWKNYGKLLHQVSEAKQWAIGDWLLDGMRHYEEEHGENKKYAGTGLYQQAERIIGIGYGTLIDYAWISKAIRLPLRKGNLSYSHHKTVASIKIIEEQEDGKLKLSNEPDTEKMQELLSMADRKRLSVSALQKEVKKYKEGQQEYIQQTNKQKVNQEKGKEEPEVEEERTNEVKEENETPTPTGHNKQTNHNKQTDSEEFDHDKYITETDKMATRFFDRVQRILQGDVQPKTKAAYYTLSGLRVNFIRAIRLAGEMGINVPLVWEKWGYLDDKFGLGEYELDDSNNVEEREIIDITPNQYKEN